MLQDGSHSNLEQKVPILEESGREEAGFEVSVWLVERGWEEDSSSSSSSSDPWNSADHHEENKLQRCKSKLTYFDILVDIKTVKSVFSTFFLHHQEHYSNPQNQIDTCWILEEEN